MVNNTVPKYPPRINPILGAMIKHSQKSWWQVRYESGDITNEWDTLQGVKLFLPFGSSKTSRWEEIDKKRIRGLYLLCPDGNAAALETDGEFLFFQLKTGHVSLGGGSTCAAHVIGKVNDLNGNCTCYAWEYEEKRLIKFEDNITSLIYRNIGALSLGQHTGVM